MSTARAFHDHETASSTALPGKAPGAFRTISEVAEDLNVPQHVLRFWETRFSQIRPLKRGGGRRYYRPEDIALLTRIHHLLYSEGYTIKGVQKLLKSNSRAQFMAEPAKKSDVEIGTAIVGVTSAAVSTALSDAQKRALHTIMGDLQELRRLLKDATGQ